MHSMKETALPLLSKQLARVLLRGEGEIHSYSSASITHHDSAHLGSENPQAYTFVAQLDLYTKSSLLFNSWVYTGDDAESTHSNFIDVAMHVACGTHGSKQLQ